MTKDMILEYFHSLALSGQNASRGEIFIIFLFLALPACLNFPIEVHDIFGEKRSNVGAWRNAHQNAFARACLSNTNSRKVALWVNPVVCVIRVCVCAHHQFFMLLFSCLLMKRRNYRVPSFFCNKISPECT